MGGFEFWDVYGLSDPFKLRVPFLKPWHSQDNLGFSEVKYHESDSF